MTKLANKNYHQLRPHFVQSGFTLIEMILYVALVSLFLSAAIYFSWDIIYGRVKSQVQVDVNDNLCLATQKITSLIRNATAVNYLSGSTLALSYSDTALNPTLIMVDQGILYLGQGSSGSCSSLAPCALTSDNLSVTNLNFTNLSQPPSTNLQFSITIESISDRPEWQKSQTYTSSVELIGQ